MRFPTVFVAAVILTIAFACTPARKSSSGFHLPDGDPEIGKALFFEMRCNNCHRVLGVDNPASAAAPTTPVTLGGKVPYVRTDGELATSIIDPSYKLAVGYRREEIEVGGRSRMPDTAHQMTVRQMIDLVAFLQSHYELQQPAPLR